MQIQQKYVEQECRQRLFTYFPQKKRGKGDLVFIGQSSCYHLKEKRETLSLPLGSFTAYIDLTS